QGEERAVEADDGQRANGMRGQVVLRIGHGTSSREHIANRYAENAIPRTRSHVARAAPDTSLPREHAIRLAQVRQELQRDADGSTAGGARRCGGFRRGGESSAGRGTDMTRAGAAHVIRSAESDARAVGTRVAHMRPAEASLCATLCATFPSSTPPAKA